MHDESRTAAVLYGSETGHAADYAAEVGRLLERLRFTVDILSLNQVQPVSLASYGVACIVISTTGQGDLPHNSRLFWKELLRKRLAASHLQDVTFAAFGLGDSSYPQFNWAVRKLSKRLAQLGAHELVLHGEGDEQAEEGVDGSFSLWAAALSEKLGQICPLAGDLTPVPATESLPPRWHLVTSKPTDVPSIDADELPMSLAASAINLPVELVSNIRLTPATHWQDVRHLVFQSSVSASYKPGDTVTIFPENSLNDVTKLMRFLRWEEHANELVRLEAGRAVGPASLSHPPIQLPQSHPITFKELLTKYIDINAVPHRSFFSLMSHYADDHAQKERLQEFAHPDHLDELYDYTTRPRRSILEVLEEFDSLRVPWTHAVHVLPPLRGRAFSIASGGTQKSNSHGQTRIELLVAIVKYRTVIKKVREGVCTRYLANLQPATRLDIQLREGDLCAQHDQDRPAIMIAPGTGLAPMRSLIWERQARCMANERRGAEWGDGEAGDAVRPQNLLIFGCRNEAADFFFRSEWDGLSSNLPLTVLPAFSRDQPSKKYVQDLIRSNGTMTQKLVQDDAAIVYVCGSSGNMPKAVRQALLDVLSLHGHMDAHEAEAYLGQMERSGRYKQETWG